MSNTNKGYSATNFWAKHIALALALIVGAIVLINYQGGEQESTSEAPPKPSVSSGLTDFYEEYRAASTKPVKEVSGDFVLDLPEADEPLDSQLKAMETTRQPVSGNWVGSQRHRSFGSGATLRQAISAYAQEEGMDVVWNLKQDFVIKSHFQIEDTLVGSLNAIAKAIDANFEGQVKTFVCPDLRSLVVTSEVSDYLKKRCNLVR